MSNGIVEQLEGMQVVRYKSGIDIITCPSGKQYQFTQTYSGNWKAYPVSASDMDVKQFTGTNGLPMPEEMIMFFKSH